MLVRDFLLSSLKKIRYRIRDMVNLMRTAELSRDLSNYAIAILLFSL